MLSLSDVKIDAIRTCGSKFLCVGVSPIVEYMNGVRTDKIVGFRYSVVLPERGFEKIGVKIEGEKQIDDPEGCVEVCFEGLELTMYVFSGNPQISARAKGIKPVKGKS